MTVNQFFFFLRSMASDIQGKGLSAPTGKADAA
jgi:hypothetical protein